MSNRDNRPFVFSDLVDTVRQRELGLLERHRRDGTLGEWYARRINFDAFLGFRHVWTDPAVLDGQAFCSLIRPDDNGVCWYDRLLFAPEGVPAIRVASLQDSLQDALISRLHGPGDKLRPFTFSIIADDEERERVAEHLSTVDKHRVYDLESLLKVIRDAGVEPKTAEQLESHWRRCFEWQRDGKLEVVKQNVVRGKSQQFNILNGFSVFGLLWMELRERWHELSDAEGKPIGRLLENSVYDLLIQTHTNRFQRSWFDNQWIRRLNSALKRSDPQAEREVNDLLALREYYYGAYNAEIARCNGVSFDFNHPFGVAGLSRDYAVSRRILRGDIEKTDEVIKTPPDIFASLTDLTRAELAEILKSSGYERWIAKRDTDALQSSIDALYKRQQLRKKDWPGWIDPALRGVVKRGVLPISAGSAVGMSTMWLLDQTIPVKLAPEHDPLGASVELAAQYTSKYVHRLSEAALRRISECARLKYDMLIRYDQLTAAAQRTVHR